MEECCWTEVVCCNDTVCGHLEAICSIEGAQAILGVLGYTAAVAVFIKFVLVDMYGAACWGSPALCALWAGLFMIAAIFPVTFVAVGTVWAIYIAVQVLTVAACKTWQACAGAICAGAICAGAICAGAICAGAKPPLAEVVGVAIAPLESVTVV